MDLPGIDDRPIWDVWLSVYQMPALTTADELGLFEAIGERPQSAEELAERLDLNESALRALLPLLASLDFLQIRLGKYHLTEPARIYLLKGSPLYWGHAFVIHRRNPYAERFTAALKSKPVGSIGLFKTGERPVESWARGQLDPAMARSVCTFMHSHSLPAALGLARNGRFEGIKRLLDVGGGSGCFSITLAQQRPQLRCTVMELPVMAELAQGYIDAAGVGDRVDVREVDMFRQPWPEGYDSVFMSNIFHDWDLQTCSQLAAKAHQVLPAGGRILLHEMLMDDDGSGPLPAASFAMQMLAGTNGRQYSAIELSQLLQRAGFVDVEAAPAYGYFSLVTAFKR